MRNIILTALFTLFTVGASAQESPTLAQERLNELVSMTKNEVKNTGNNIIDNYTSALYDLTGDVVDNGKDLTSLLEEVKSGALTKVEALTKANTLSEKVSGAVEKVKGVTEKAKSATSQIKNLKGFSLKALATQTIANNSKISSLLGEETINQVKTIGSLIMELSKNVKDNFTK